MFSFFFFCIIELKRNQDQILYTAAPVVTRENQDDAVSFIYPDDETFIHYIIYSHHIIPLDVLLGVTQQSIFFGSPTFYTQ